MDVREMAVRVPRTWPESYRKGRHWWRVEQVVVGPLHLVTDAARFLGLSPALSWLASQLPDAV